MKMTMLKLPISEVVMQLDSSLRGQKTVLRDGEK